MESSLLEMQGEYETIMDEKAKANSIKFQANMMMAAINGIEFLNGRFDPFDIKLDGWGEQVNENISDYDEIFAQLHQKYNNHYDYMARCHLHQLLLQYQRIHYK